MMWSEVLQECREKNKKALARRGRKFPPSKQECVSDNELLKQIASLGAFDHPHYERLLGEAHHRWGTK